MRVRALGCVLWLCSAAVFAQSFTPVRELKNLSPAAIEKLHKLETLTALPTGEWRFHVGDVPHGEAVGLDDSAWTLATPRSETSTGKGPKNAKCTNAKASFA